MNRRGFLKSALAGLATLTGAMMPFAIARMLNPSSPVVPSRHLRPPGALKDDTAFVAACIGCGICGEVCPPKCILFHRRDGAGESNTPYIDPNVAGCTLCKKCTDVCPTEALMPVADIRNIDMGVADIDETACYPWVDRGICGACAIVCPLGERAIGFDFANMYRPIVRQGCVGCGMCVEVCPHPRKPIRIADREMSNGGGTKV